LGGEVLDAEELKKRTKEFAHKCVKLALALPKTELGNHLRKQLIRCATSVAANYRATLLAQTKAAFISKISIVIEEADESEFWLEFIIDEKGVRLILRSKLGKMTVDEKRPEMLPAIAQDERSKCKNSLTAINGPSHA